ncbi:MAG: LVIVD repeat-containing protein [Actinomycetota bacterium]
MKPARPLFVAVVVAALAIALLPAPGRADDAVAQGLSSSNVQYVKYVPFEVGTATGARLVGKYLYVTSWRSISIYDISDPVDPQLMSLTPIGFQFESEDVATNGRILIFSETLPQVILHVWDVTDKTKPVEIAQVFGLADHTSTCILDCTYVYGSNGKIVDLRDPANPVLVGNWGAASGASVGHDVREVAPGVVSVASSQGAILDASDPLHPRLLSRIVSAQEHPNHSTAWPNDGSDRFMLGSSETFVSGPCTSASGATTVWDMSGWRETGQYRMADVWKPRNGVLFDGSPPGNAMGCSAHWLEPSPSFHDGGLFAEGYYEHGSRFFFANGAGKITEVGFFLPFGGSTSATYWITDRIVYAVDYTRGLDILRWTGPLPHDPAERNAVSALTVSSSGGATTVDGTATFAGETSPVVLADDPTGDGPLQAEASSEAGADLTQFSVQQADAADPYLTIRWKVTNLPLPNEGGAPEIVRYLWDFGVGTQRYSVFAMLTSVLTAAATLTPTDDPNGEVTKQGRSFELRGNCSGSGVSLCHHIAWLDGSFDVATKTVSVRIPIGAPYAPEIVPGAVLGPRSDSSIAAELNAGLSVVGGPATMVDEAEWTDEDAYIVPERTVTVGVAPPGTDPSQVTYSTPATLASNGSFTASIDTSNPPPGWSKLYVRACFGTSCAYSSTPLGT